MLQGQLNVSTRLIEKSIICVDFSKYMYNFSAPGTGLWTVFIRSNNNKRVPHELWYCWKSSFYCEEVDLSWLFSQWNTGSYGWNIPCVI